MIKNLTGQKWTVFAFDATTGLPEAGDADNITANLRLDGGAANAVDDTNPTELEDGYYIFDLTQAETNADHIIICPQSSTDDIVVIGVPGAVWTTPVKQAVTLAAVDVTGNLPANVAQWKGTTAPDNTGDAFARLGANGAGLTALPWNAAWDAEVQSECTDALNAYDPPTNTEMTARTLASENYATAAALNTVDDYIDTEVSAIKAVTDILGTVVEPDGAVYRFTAEALEQAPTGGGTAPSAEQIADAVWDEVLHTAHENAGSASVLLQASGGAADPLLNAVPGAYAPGSAGYKLGHMTSLGPGAISWPYTLTDSVSGLPIEGAEVWVTTDIAGANVIASGVTDGNGIVTFLLDAGTVYVFRKKGGFNFINPDQETVS